MNPLQQVIKRRSDEFEEKVNFSGKDGFINELTGQISAYKISSHNQETVEAILEAELKEIGEDEEEIEIDMGWNIEKDGSIDGSFLCLRDGDFNKIPIKQIDREINIQKSAEWRGRNQERNRLRQIILSTLQDIKK